MDTDSVMCLTLSEVPGTLRMESSKSHNQLTSRVCRMTTPKNVMVLEEKRAHASHLTLLLDKDFKVLVDNGDSQ